MGEDFFQKLTSGNSAARWVFRVMKGERGITIDYTAVGELYCGDYAINGQRLDFFGFFWIFLDFFGGEKCKKGPFL
jgi:hypothetical protein